MFVRRTYLEFVRLQFDDTAKLWVSFVSFGSRRTESGSGCRIAAADPIFDELGVQGTP